MFCVWINWSMVPAVRKKQQQQQKQIKTNKPEETCIGWCEFVCGSDQKISIKEWKCLTIKKKWSVCAGVYVCGTVSWKYRVFVFDLMCVRWWRDVLLVATSTVSIDDSSETDWRWKLLDSRKWHCIHTPRDRQSDTNGPTSQPTVRPTDRQCNFFPFSLHFVRLSLYLLLSVCLWLLLLLLLLHAHRIQEVWRTQCDCAKYIQVNGAQESV